jgi:hypothetical protein
MDACGQQTPRTCLRPAIGRVFYGRQDFRCDTATDISRIFWKKAGESAATGNGHYLTYAWKQSNISFKFVKFQDGD